MRRSARPGPPTSCRRSPAAHHALLPTLPTPSHPAAHLPRLFRPPPLSLTLHVHARPFRGPPLLPHRRAVQLAMCAGYEVPGYVVLPPEAWSEATGEEAEVEQSSD